MYCASCMGGGPWEVVTVGVVMAEAPEGSRHRPGMHGA